MDLDDARKRVKEADDVPGLSDVLLELLDLVGNMGTDHGANRLRIQDLEREVETLKADVEVLAGRTEHARKVDAEIKRATRT